jgi:glycosyltransferase involved in cell wall biosynthesis
MQHIAIDARDSGTSTGRYIDKLIEHLHSLQPAYDITILTKPHRLEYMSKIAPNFSVEACPHKEFTFDEQIGFKRQLDNLKPDLVHFAAVQQPVWYKGTVVTTMQDLTTLRFRNPAKNPVVFVAKQQIYRWVNLRVAHKSKLLITPSEFVKQDVVNFSGVDPAKITVTYEAADDLPTPAEPVSSLAGKRYIMYVGRPTPHKNLERLIQAFALVQKTDPTLYLALAGKKDANYQRIEAEAARQGIANIIFTDFVSDQQLRWLFEHCQAYVFPSLSEGFGLPALEAMQHGAPVVSSNATCLPELYQEAALYFDPLNIHDIADKISTMITDQSLRNDYIGKGKIQASKYSWHRMAEQTLAVYAACLSTM